MRKYYLSHIDFSEIINVTADEEQILKSKEQMLELDLITEKKQTECGCYQDSCC